MFRFFYETLGHKHYEDIIADSFRRARNIFFENHATARNNRIIAVWTVDDSGNLLNKVYAPKH